MYRSPAEIGDGLEFMERHARALRWVLGMFTHWSWTPPAVAACWRFFVLRRNGRIEALACHQSWSGWWGLSARSEEAALEAWRHITPLGALRHLEGELEHLRAIQAVDDTLDRRLVREEVSRVMRRASAGFDRVVIDGFRPAVAQDLTALLAYHEACPGPGRAPSSQEIRRQIARGAVYVLERSGSVAALGKAVPAGSHSYLRDIFTFPVYRRQGCARQLVEGLLGALARQRRDACLCVSVDNIAGIDLYETLGFEPWGERLHLTLRLPAGR